MASSRTPDQIRADIAAARAAMSANVEGLVAEVHPVAIKNRAVNDAKEAVAEQVQEARSYVMDDSGPRWDRIGTGVLVATGVGLVLGTLKLIGKAVRG